MKMLNTITCRYRRRQIGRWLDLSARRRAQLQAHVQQCEGCHRELDHMLHVHAQLHRARQAYRGMTYSGPRPIAVEQASPAWWPGTAWQLAPAGLAVVCVLGLMVWWQGPESPGSQVPRASYRIMSIPVEMRPAVAVKVLPTLRKRARLQLATPLFTKPRGMAFRYPKRPVRDRGVSRRDHSTQHRQSYRARLS